MPRFAPSLIVALIPVSFILGVLAININIFLITIFSLYIFVKNKEKFKFILIDKVIFVFFLYLLLNGIINSIEYILFKKGYFIDYTVIIKSFSYLRFFALYISLRILLELRILKLKYLYWTTTISVLFVSLDLIYQLLNGKDIFGFVSPYSKKLTGPFGQEAIAGSYLQKFSLISILSLLFFLQINKLKKHLLILFLIGLITFGIIISGNRMSIVLFFLSLILASLNLQVIKKYSLLTLTIILILFTLTFKFNPNVNDYFKNFYNVSSSIVNLYIYRVTGVGNDLPEKKRPSYIHEFDNGVGTWKMNKYFGGGIKSYRYNCPYRTYSSPEERTTCNMHPHNYYLEILSDLGIFGMLYFLYIVFSTFKSFIKIPNRSIEKYITYPFLFILLIEFFPLRSSGSIFTTTNSSIIFFALAVIVSMGKLAELKSHNN